MRTSRAVPALLGIAALVRLFYVAQNRHSPFFTQPIIDGAEYVARARAILADGLGWDHVPIHAPLYPSLVAGVFGATDGSFLALIVLQHVLGLATLFLLHRVARAAFGETAALVALGLGALSWAPVYFEGQPISEPLVTFLLMLSAWLLLRADREKGWRG
ncbi:glycosyltransferase family 39 protein, partial [bacterium]|nr:glycosyltransferase family 39 protein [bacterium]